MKPPKEISDIHCCDLMFHATQHAIIRTGPVRFGPDVLDPPLNNINYCPWCGAAMTKKAAMEMTPFDGENPEGGKDVNGCDI